MPVNDWCNCQTCDSFIFSVLPSDPTCQEEIFESQICGVIILPSGVTPPADWTSRTLWAGVIDNTNTNNAAAKYLPVIGGVDVPDKNEVTVAKGYKKVTSKTYSFQGEIKALDDVIRNFITSFECNPSGYRVWFETLGGNLFGGPTGIYVNFSDADLPLGAGEDDIEMGVLSIEWRASCAPLRAAVGSIITAENESNTISQLWGTDSNNVWGVDATNTFGIV